jgi:D-glycero-D-manno-heptose 1,7-bisphosphate phosphatase
MGVPGIFLDRDGVLNENRPDHVKCWDEFRLLPGVIDALVQLAHLDVPIVIITNQAAVSRTLISHTDVSDIHDRFLTLARNAGARIDAIFYCPHDNHEQCECRKPLPGLFFAAAEQHNIDLSQSVLVGDAHTDVVAGRRAGCKTILVLTGRGRESIPNLPQRPIVMPHAIVSDLRAAVPVICRFLKPSLHALPNWRRASAGFLQTSHAD